MRLSLLLICFVLYTERSSAKKSKVKCGKPKVKEEGFHIWNGKKALKGQWPWMVSIEERPHVDSDKYTHICGGALMDSGWIVTAAHCFEYADPRHYRIILGQHDRTKAEEEGRQVFKPKMFIDHKNFWVRETDDIALVAVEGEIQHTDWVMPLCSLRDNMDMEWMDEILTEDAQVLDCYVAGWGRTEEGRRSDVLRYTQMSVWPREKCKAEFGADMFDPHTNLCCQNKDSPLKDACKADSGGPIFCRRYKTAQEKWDRWRLHGLVSWGEECGFEDNPPGIYTNIMAYYTWIDENIKEYS